METVGEEMGVVAVTSRELQQLEKEISNLQQRLRMWINNKAVVDPTIWVWHDSVDEKVINLKKELHELKEKRNKLKDV